MKSFSRGAKLAALLVAAAVIGGCARQAAPAVPVRAAVKSGRGAVVATVEQTRPGDALRLYLYRWMLHYNDSSAAQPDVSDAGWTPEVPDDVVSVVPPMPVSDLKTLAVWSASITPLGPVTRTHAAYRADFQFWRGSPLSSAAPATSLESSATYDLSWDSSRRAWAITQTSEPPDSRLVEAARQSTGTP